MLLHLIATAPMGLESVVARELKELGMKNIATENGRVNFVGGLTDIARANLWLRTSDRILIKLAEFPARTFDELFEGTKAIDWADWIPQDGEFPVDGRSIHSVLTSVPACQGIVKKAIVEKLKEAYGGEWFSEDGAHYRVEMWLRNDIAMITLDTSGAGLHKRGYRKLVGAAPLKETLAAALVLLSRWQPHRPLYDPFCGSGTILIEAAMIGWNIAPGLRRNFAAEEWTSAMPPEIFAEAREEAFDLVHDDIPLQIAGSDISPDALDVARGAISKAGFANQIEVHELPVKKMKPSGDYGCIITNPPYGERLGDEAAAEFALRDFGYASLFLPTWSFFAISPSKQLEHYFGREANKRRKLYNGRIECQYYQYFGPLPKRS
jgi:putative N6-adenine-specific DNA methylase